MPDADWRDALRRQIQQHEGVRLKPYRDSVGLLTIGYGRNLDDVGISAQEAEYLLSNDILRVFADLDRELPWWRQLDDIRKRVIADMAFNMGITRLLGFKNTLAAVKAGDYEKAADGMKNSVWYSQVGTRAKRLVAMMRFGEENPTIT